MLLVNKLSDGRVRHRLKTLMVKPQQGYARPKMDFKTSTSIWNIDEFIKKRVQEWRRLTHEDGHSGTRNELRKDGIYTGTYSVFPIPLMEYIIIRYGGEVGGKILDPFAGGPPRAICSSIMGMEYHGVDVRQEQIDENQKVLTDLELNNIHYYLDDARYLNKIPDIQFDMAIACPPYYNLEVYSKQEDDMSAFPTYGTFNVAMWQSAEAQFRFLKPGEGPLSATGSPRALASAIRRSQ
jgi:DNA modification methylase